MPSRNNAVRPLVIETRRYTGRDVLILAGLATLLALAFWEVVAQGRVFFFRDFSHFFYPKRLVVAEAIRQGRIPYWNSIEGCGTPVLGSYQVAVFYPPAIIYYLLPMPQSFMWFVVFHFFLSGVGTYHMMRVWGARRVAAAFAAFAWAFSPAFIGALDYVSFHNVLAWLPWCLAFARRIMTGARFRGYVLLSIAFAMALMAGAPEPVVFIVIVLIAATAWNMGSCWYRRGFSGCWRPLALVLAALVTGVFLSGIEVIPFIHTFIYSARQRPLIMEDAGSWPFHPRDTWLLFLPRFYLFADRGGIYWPSQGWLKGVYLGILVPFLVVWTLVAVRRARNLFFAAVAAVFLLMSLGPYTPVWRFAYEHLPGVGHMRYPVKFFLPTAFAAAVLAGFAVDDFLICARRGMKARLLTLVIPLVLVALACAVSWGAMNWFPQAVFDRITPKILLSQGERGRLEALECYEATQWSFGRSAAHLAAGVAALLAAGIITRLRIPRPYGSAALVIVLFLDIGFFGQHLNPVAGPQIYTESPSRLPTVPHGLSNSRLFLTPSIDLNLSMQRLDRIPDLVGLWNYVYYLKGIRLDTDEAVLRYLERTSAPRSLKSAQEVDDWLRATKSPQFATDLESEVFRETFYPSGNLMYHVPEVDSFEPLRPRFHHDLIQKMLFREIPAGREFALAKMWGASLILDVLTVPPGFQYVPMPDPGSRAILVDHVIPVDSEEQAEATVVETGIDLTRRLVLFRRDAEAAVRLLGPSAMETPAPDAARPGGARVVSDNGNSCVFEVDASKPAILFVADNFFPNFIARVDGRPAQIWRANYAYRAVPVDQGRHTVEFTWRPYDFYAGAAVTSGSIVALVCLWLVRRRRV